MVSEKNDSHWLEGGEKTILFELPFVH